MIEKCRRCGKEEGMVVHENKDLLNTKQLARRLGVKEGWIRQNMKIIPHLKMRRHVRFDVQVVLEHFKTG